MREAGTSTILQLTWDPNTWAMTLSVSLVLLVLVFVVLLLLAAWRWLSGGLRPHLTRWQARFRSWYNRELKRYEADTGTTVIDPQQIQAAFPQYEELKKDLERVNNALIRYRSKMRELVMKD